MYVSNMFLSITKRYRLNKGTLFYEQKKSYSFNLSNTTVILYNIIDIIIHTPYFINKKYSYLIYTDEKINLLSISFNHLTFKKLKELTSCFESVVEELPGGLGNLLRNQACLKAVFGFILSSGSHSKQR